jgi:two-component system chemotaxis response regulator CheY
MPGPSGIDFLKQVRETEKFKDLPFILITTESEKQAVIQAAMAGVSAYIVKPFNIETLTKRLQEAWKKHNPD